MERQLRDLIQETRQPPVLAIAPAAAAPAASGGSGAAGAEPGPSGGGSPADTAAVLVAGSGPGSVLGGSSSMDKHPDAAAGKRRWAVVCSPPGICAGLAA